MLYTFILFPNYSNYLVTVNILGALSERRSIKVCRTLYANENSKSEMTITFCKYIGVPETTLRVNEIERERESVKERGREKKGEKEKWRVANTFSSGARKNERSR